MYFCYVINKFCFFVFIIDFYDTGNMAYGVLAKASGMTDVLMELGAGVINAKEAFKNSNGKIEFLKTLNRELSWILTYGDDPRDNEAIKIGVEYYYRL